MTRLESLNHHITSLFLCFVKVNHVLPPLSSLVTPGRSRLEDVRRRVWNRWQRCPANPAVLLASGHGGDQEPDCGTLRNTNPHANERLRFSGFDMVSNTHTQARTEQFD